MMDEKRVNEKKREKKKEITDKRLGEVVEGPRADFAISGDGDEVVGVGSTDDLDTVDGVSVAVGREGGLLHRRRFGPCVPHHDLARVRSSKNKRRVALSKLRDLGIKNLGLLRKSTTERSRPR